MNETDEPIDPAAEAEVAPGAAEITAEHVRLAEALLFAAAEPVTEKALAAILPEGLAPAAVVAVLGDGLAGRGVEVVAVAGGWMMRTAPDLAPLLRKRFEVPRRLSRAAVEALAIVAYHQPVTRAEIEDIRGVALAQGTLDTLVEAGFVEPKGRRETPGRPATWGTTAQFLAHFGLASIKDLPKLDELKAAGLLEPLPPSSSSAGSPGAEPSPPGGVAEAEEEAPPPLDPEPEEPQARGEDKPV
ncbi:SMC-Scp complex subunit ScpB [Elioraea rosea]|uniref:SMC-Scp complex subunit ScpB n=1 Tax=Elioraea rosea TaxID=2492390 RepID=UPI001185BF82|nr:SMC-Scp complex subunit ScpB [Elioraea rosea]